MTDHETPSTGKEDDTNPRDPAAATDTTGAVNPFELPGLPAYAGLATSAVSTPRKRRTGERKSGSKGAGKGSDYSGEWSQWLDRSRRTPSATTEDADAEISEDELPAYLDEEEEPVPTLRERRGRIRVRPFPESEFGDTGSRISRWWPTIVWSVAAAVAVAAIGTAVAVNIRASSADPPPTAAPPPPAPASTTTGAAGTSALPPSWDHATAGCTRTRSGTMTVGADPGDHTSPHMAILGFEWSYYVERDATMARTFTTPDATVSDVETLQAGIDSQPDGVRYCVYITAGDAAGQVWDVELHEQWPDDPEPMRYGQQITTVTEHGKTLITGISKS